MRITLELDDVEATHLLQALEGVVDIVERRSDELVAAVILRSMIAKVVRAVKEAG